MKFCILKMFKIDKKPKQNVKDPRTDTVSYRVACTRLPTSIVKSGAAHPALSGNHCITLKMMDFLRRISVAPSSRVPSLAYFGNGDT